MMGTHNAVLARRQLAARAALGPIPAAVRTATKLALRAARTPARRAAVIESSQYALAGLAGIWRAAFDEVTRW